jgi:hypothetical protein
MEEIGRWLPLLIPVLVLELLLMIIALVDWFRREQTKGPRWAWLLVILFVQIVGPIAYLLFGREESYGDD